MKNYKKISLTLFSIISFCFAFGIVGLNSKVYATTSKNYSFSLSSMNGGSCDEKNTFPSTDSDKYDDWENSFHGKHTVSTTINPTTDNYKIKSITFNTFPNFYYDDHLIFTINDVVIFTSSYTPYNDSRWHSIYYQLGAIGAVSGNLRLYKDTYFYPGLNGKYLKGNGLSAHDTGGCIGGVAAGGTGCQIPISQQSGTVQITIGDAVATELKNYLNSPDYITLKVTATGDNDIAVDCTCCSNGSTGNVCNSGSVCLSGQLTLEYYDDLTPVGTITGTKIISLDSSLKGSGTYNLGANDPKGGDIGDIGTYYKRIKDKSGIAVTDSWHGIVSSTGSSEVACTGVSSSCSKSVTWIANSLAEGTYQLAVNVYEPDDPWSGTTRAGYCTGSPECGDKALGVVCSHSTDYLDCDPYRTGSADLDVMEVRIVKAGCLNGVVESGEECDDGNSVNTDKCTNTCKKTYCGDTTIQSPNYAGIAEVCDNGSSNSSASTCYSTSGVATSVCTTGCVLKSCGYCGDSIVNGSEDCDKALTPDTCYINCTWKNQPWFKTNLGDIYSSVGVNQNPSVTMNLSKYMCLKSDGNFQSSYLTDGITKSPCSVQSGGDSKWIKNETSLEYRTSDEFDSLVKKLNSQFNGSTSFSYTSDDGITINGKIIAIDKTSSSITNDLGNNVYYLTKNLTINGNIKNTCADQSTCSLLIVVEGDVTIASDVEQIDALIISNGKIIVNSKGSANDSQLTVNGGLIALGKRTNITFTSPIFSTIYFDRDMANVNNNSTPTEVINYDPRFLDIFRELLGDVGRINFSESGIY